jgi:hypothetical protein
MFPVQCTLHSDSDQATVALFFARHTGQRSHLFLKVSHRSRVDFNLVTSELHLVEQHLLHITIPLLSWPGSL